MKKHLFIVSPFILTGCLWNYETLSADFLKIGPPKEDYQSNVQPSVPIVAPQSDFSQQGPREFYEWAAASDYPQAQEVMGLLLLYGESSDLEKGQEYLEKAYSKKSLTAGLELAKLYSEGRLIAINYDKAMVYLEDGLKAKNLNALNLAASIQFAQDNKSKGLYYLELAAEAGDLDAKKQLAKMLVAEKSGSWRQAQELTAQAQQEGLYEELDDLKDFWPERYLEMKKKPKSIIKDHENQSLLNIPVMPKSYPNDFQQSFSQAAVKGSPYAAYQEVLQRVYTPRQHQGVVNTLDLLTLLNIAEKKIIPAKVLKARLIMKGYWPDLKKNESFKLLTEAAEQQDPYAFFALSLFARQDGRYEDSVNLFIKAKQQNNYGAAQFQVAQDLIQGYFPFWDDRLAYDWVIDLAQLNYNPALLLLADLKEAHKIAAESSEEIFLHRLKAAWQGSTQGQYLIANMYLKGEAVEANAVKAFRWFNVAAHGGYRPAQLQIGLMYEQGNGILPSFPKAYAWQKLASNDLYENIDQKLHELALLMSQEELYQALRLEQLFKENYS
jgi:TPR repeat protein